MPNDHFQFKQFIVQQGRTAMKVSTDACIQAALAAKFWQDEDVRSLLDIGTGTGLLSLMLAQKLQDARVMAIEIEAAALAQAKDNFAASPWNGRLTGQRADLRSMAVCRPFDAIICNPPFFHKHLNSTDAGRNKARHDVTLSKEDLAVKVADLLKDAGTFCVLYPNSEWASWCLIAAHSGLHLQHEVAVRPYSGKAANRMIGFFKKQVPRHLSKTTLTIYQDAGKTYSPDFVSLMEDYYLHL